MAQDGGDQPLHPSPSIPLPVEGRGRPGEPRSEVCAACVNFHKQEYAGHAKNSFSVFRVFRGGSLGWRRGASATTGDLVQGADRESHRIEPFVIPQLGEIKSERRRK